jgi:hypothetical protein
MFANAKRSAHQTPAAAEAAHRGKARLGEASLDECGSVTANGIKKERRFAEVELKVASKAPVSSATRARAFGGPAQLRAAGGNDPPQSRKQHIRRFVKAVARNPDSPGVGEKGCACPGRDTGNYPRTVTSCALVNGASSALVR